LTNLGNALMRLKLAAQAIEAHDRAIRLKPDYADAYCNRGMAELVLNRNEQADLSFDRALSLRPGHLEALVGKALVSLNQRHFNAAESGRADPVSIPEAVRHLFVEKIHDLPCMITMEMVPGLHSPLLPMIRNKHVTFGVFNRIDKISDGALVAPVIENDGNF
jgi:tetratricopeptide (TPR) repeat protein